MPRADRETMARAFFETGITPDKLAWYRRDQGITRRDVYEVIRDAHNELVGKYRALVNMQANLHVVVKRAA